MQLSDAPTGLGEPQAQAEQRRAVAVGEPSGGPADADPEVDELQARLDKLRKD